MKIRTFFIATFAAVLFGADFDAYCSTIKRNSFSENQIVSGFQVKNVYLDGNNREIALKFAYLKNEFPVYVLRIETVPQAFIWFRTDPDSDQGLPHSLEHLLAGKGTTGRYFGLLAQMRLGEEGAATDQNFTFYHFDTGGKIPTFFEQLRSTLRALLMPDFSDEEAEREFYHMSLETSDGKKSLVENGTVYDEMQTGQGSSRYWFQLLKQVLGKNHPQTFDAGGDPEEMRTVTPAEIRRFHADHYFLGPNAGLIVAIPPGQSIASFLSMLDLELKPYSQKPSPYFQSPSPYSQKLPPHSQPASPFAQTSQFTATSAKIEPSADSAMKLVSYPSKSATEPAQMSFAWKVIEAPSIKERILLHLLLDGFAGGKKSNLYRSMIDSKTREIETGATDVSYFEDVDVSQAKPIIFVSVAGIPGNQVTEAKMEAIRMHLLAELKEIAELKEGSKELEEFNRRAISYISGWQRSLEVWSASPPRFGKRETVGDWKKHFEFLDLSPSFEKSLVYQTSWGEITSLLKDKKNIWSDVIKSAHLSDLPYGAASIPSPEKLSELEKNRTLRLKAKLAALKEKYKVNNDEEALSHYEQEENLKTEKISKIEKLVERPRFTASPPLTPDDSVKYSEVKIQGVPTVFTQFEGAPTLDIGMHFNLSDVPKRLYRYLPLLPSSLISVGIKGGGRIIGYRELDRMIQQDIYLLASNFDSNQDTGRVELEIRASGTTAEEFQKALGYMNQVIHNSYVEISNRSRFQDLIEQNITKSDEYTKQWEEYWIRNPAVAFRNQTSLLSLVTQSEFTRAHYFDRLKWQLSAELSPGEFSEFEKKSAEVIGNLSSLSKSDGEREIQKEIQGVGPATNTKDFLIYLARIWKKLPDSGFAPILEEIRAETLEDLRLGPSAFIDGIKELQRTVLRKNHLKLDLTMSPKEYAINKKEVEKQLAALGESGKNKPETESESGLETEGWILKRMKTRYPNLNSDFPRYVGLVFADSTNGDIIITSKVPSFENTSPEALATFLAADVFGGGGPHSFFMKTWEAGLAYSNGVSVSREAGRFQYYAERSPKIAGTLSFVKDLANRDKALNVPQLADYIYALAFSISRESRSFSARGEALASDLRDHYTPKKYRKFSKALLAFHKRKNFLNEVKSKVPGVLATVLPGDQERARQSQSLFFLIGSEVQLKEAENLLPEGQTIYRIAPSDFWMP